MSRPVCATCGSFDVALEATAAYWNVSAGQAEASDLCDKGHYCNTCDGECRLTWIDTFLPEVTKQELDTILAALRWWQDMEMYNPEICSRRSPDIFEIAVYGTTDILLSEDEIDALCERINA